MVQSTFWLHSWGRGERAVFWWLRNSRLSGGGRIGSAGRIGRGGGMLREGVVFEKGFVFGNWGGFGAEGLCLGRL